MSAHRFDDSDRDFVKRTSCVWIAGAGHFGHWAAIEGDYLVVAAIDHSDPRWAEDGHPLGKVGRGSLVRVAQAEPHRVHLWPMGDLEGRVASRVPGTYDPSTLRVYRAWRPSRPHVPDRIWAKAERHKPSGSWPLWRNCWGKDDGYLAMLSVNNGPWKRLASVLVCGREQIRVYRPGDAFAPVPGWVVLPGDSEPFHSAQWLEARVRGWVGVPFPDPSFLEHLVRGDGHWPGYRS